MIEPTQRNKIDNRKGKILLSIAVLATAIMAVLKLTILDITWFVVIIPMLCYVAFLIVVLVLLFVAILRLNKVQLQDLEEAIKEKHEND